MTWNICAVSKNEGLYIQEWAAYHKVIGCKKIFLYDAETDDTKQKLAQYIDEGFVKFIPWHIHPAQWQAYSDYITGCQFEDPNEFKEWAALIDIDEFILPMGEESIEQFLGSFDERVSGIGIGWHMFGSNNRYLRPKENYGSVIMNYYRCQDYQENKERMTKCFIRPNLCLSHVRDPHYFDPKPGFRIVREDGVELRWGDHHHRKNEDFPTERVRLNHYFTKSFEDWLVKFNRHGPDGNFRQMLDFAVMQEQSTDSDFQILAFKENLIEEMQRIGAWSQ